MPHKNYKQWYETEGREYYRKKSAEARKNKLHTKMSSFKRRSKQIDPLLTVANLKAKFGSNPVCYLTGTPIDLSNTKSYELDHIIPVSRGGDSSLANCGLASSFANQSKSDLTAQEFIALCQQVADFSRTVK